MSKMRGDAMTTRTYTYRDWRDLLGLAYPPPDCSVDDADGTEVTLYPDGSAAYTDGGTRVPIRADEEDAMRAIWLESKTGAVSNSPWERCSTDQSDYTPADGCRQLWRVDLDGTGFLGYAEEHATTYLLDTGGRKLHAPLGSAPPLGWVKVLADFWGIDLATDPSAEVDQ